MAWFKRTSRGEGSHPHRVEAKLSLYKISIPFRGGDLGRTGGTVPPKFEVGGRPMHPFPPIFGEVVLSDAHESMNRLKKVFFL